MESLLVALAVSFAAIAFEPPVAHAAGAQCAARRAIMVIRCQRAAKRRSPTLIRACRNATASYNNCARRSSR